VIQFFEQETNTAMTQKEREWCLELVLRVVFKQGRCNNGIHGIQCDCSSTEAPKIWKMKPEIVFISGLLQVLRRFVQFM
jgi:hypothetical protein